MDITRLETISYSEGFIGDVLDQYIEEIDEETASQSTLEQAAQIKAMWTVLSEGLRDLRRENATLESRIASVRLILA